MELSHRETGENKKIIRVLLNVMLKCNESYM